jgi:metal-responsive CopG/Arc/MetJ family transcriptional regulator
MKTAISIPDDLFAMAEQLAARFGVSRSELYATAIREYVAAHHYDRVTERLNAIYDQEPSNLDPALMELQVRSLPPEEW